MSTLILKHSLIGFLICLSILIVIIGLNVILEWAVVENFNINNVEVDVPVLSILGLSILSMFVFGLIKQVEERYRQKGAMIFIAIVYIPFLLILSVWNLNDVLVITVSGIYFLVLFVLFICISLFMKRYTRLHRK